MGGVLTTALRDLLDTHRAVGAEARALAATVAGGGRIRSARAHGLALVLAAQQGAEETAVFPALVAADPGFDPAGLVADHAEVIRAVRALDVALRPRRAGPDPAATAVRLARLVELHHADEEAAVVPRWDLLSPAADRAVGRALRRAHGPLGRVRLARLPRR